MRVIGLAGGAGVGKDTVASYLQQAAPHAVRVFRFANVIKTFAENVFAYQKSVLWGGSQLRDTPCTLGRENVFENFREHVEDFSSEIADATFMYPGSVKLALEVWFNTLWACCPQPSARAALQTLGTDFGRVIHPDVWVRMTLADIERHDAKIAVISDCRFINEFKAIKEVDGELWHIVRGVPVTVGAHASERDVHSPHLVELRTRLINNNDSLLALHKQVMELL